MSETHVITKDKCDDHLTILVEGEGLDDIISIKLPHCAVGHDLVAEIAIKINVLPEECHLFCEDEDKPRDLKAPICHDRIHHVHRAQKIEVSICYMGEVETKKFPPSARVQKVLDWAVSKKGFKIDPAIAPEMELSLEGKNTPLPKNAHIGRFVKHPCHELKLDLIRGVVPNG